MSEKYANWDCPKCGQMHDPSLRHDEDTISTQTKGQHTATPWRYSQALNGKWYIYGADDRAVFVPNVSATNRPKEEVQANAAFIVTACNSHEALLAACEAALDHAQIDADDGDLALEALAEIRPILRAAIAAVKGGSQ